MNPTPAVLALLSSAVIPAQVTLDVRLASDFVVKDTPVYKAPSSTVIKSGTVIPAKLSVVAGSHSALFAHSNTGGRIGYSCVMSKDCFLTVGSIVGTVVVSMKSRMTLRGTLTVRYTYNSTYLSCYGVLWSHHQVAGTVVNPPLSLYTTPATLVYPVTLDANGISISHASTLSGNVPLKYGGPTTATIDITFQPDGLLEGYGTGCGPTLLGEHDASNRLVFSASGLTSNGANSGLIIGARKTNIPLPGASCLLLTDPVISLPWVVGANGTASFGAPRPPGTFTAYAQAIDVPSSAGQLRSSNGVLVKF